MTHLRQSETLVMLALADHANDKGITWVAYDTIAAKARISTRTAMRTVAALQEQGLIKIESHYRENKSRASNVYRLILFEHSDKLSHSFSEQCDKTGEQCDIAMSPLEPSIEPKNLVGQKPPTKNLSQKTDHSYFVAWWLWSFKKIVGDEYAMTVEQAAIIKRLLKILGLGVLIERACVWLTMPDHLRFPRGSPSIYGFSRNINELAGKYNDEIGDKCFALGVLPDYDTNLKDFAPWQKDCRRKT